MSGCKNASGELNGRFGPDDDITRGQVAVILYRAANPESAATTDASAYEENTSGKSDVEDGQYYTAAVNWAVSEGVMTGDDGSTTWRPDDSITRQELAVTLARYADGAGAENDGTWKTAPDADGVSSWAVNGIGWCYSNGVMKGQGTTGALAPWGATTRAEACKMIVVTVLDVMGA